MQQKCVYFEYFRTAGILLLSPAVQAYLRVLKHIISIFSLTKFGSGK